MDVLDFECAALNERDGIFLEHSGCFQNAQLMRHDFVMIAYVAYASGYHEIDEKTIPVSDGDIFVINPGTIHRFYAADHVQWMELYYCYFLPERFSKILNRLKEDFPEYIGLFTNNHTPYLHIKDNANKEFRNVFVRMLDEFMHRPTGYRYTLESYFTVLLTKFIRTHKSALNNPVFNQNSLIDEIIRYINYYMYSGITVRQIADKHHISEAYLCRLFKKHTGKTIIQFINSIKIEKVKDILKNTDRPIESISAAMSCSPIYLKRLFKKSTGISMYEYRKKYNFKTNAAE